MRGDPVVHIIFSPSIRLCKLREPETIELEWVFEMVRIAMA